MRGLPTISRRPANILFEFVDGLKAVACVYARDSGPWSTSNAFGVRQRREDAILRLAECEQMEAGCCLELPPRPQSTESGRGARKKLLIMVGLSNAGGTDPGGGG